jgi:transcriptional regulator with XRE-family HTH domain
MSTEMFRMATFEERIVAAFSGANLKEVAEKMGVNYHTLRNWAKETRDIPPAELKKIAKLTKVSLNWLLLEEGERFPGNNAKFDLEYAIEHHDDWMDVVDEWYAAEGRSNPMPDSMGASFMGGWKSFDLKQKIDAVTDFKRFLDLTFPQNEKLPQKDQ